MLFTGKLAVRHNRVGELGISYLGGAYNKFEDDGLVLDRKRSVRVYAIDFNTRLPFKTAITGEWAWVRVDLPADFTEQFGRKQEGGFVDIIQPVLTRRMFGFDNAVLNAGIRLEFVDWNKGKFSSTGENISEHIYSLVPSISWRPNAETVFRINYRYNWQSDLLGNPAKKMAAFQMGIATYF